ncbi:hypothetical protein NQZ68_028497, partial [Dissostichus eleginoides]
MTGVALTARPCYIGFHVTLRCFSEGVTASSDQMHADTGQTTKSVSQDEADVQLMIHINFSPFLFPVGASGVRSYFHFVPVVKQKFSSSLNSCIRMQHQSPEPGPGSSCVSMKSDRSMDHPDNFKSGHKRCQMSS